MYGSPAPFALYPASIDASRFFRNKLPRDPTNQETSVFTKSLFIEESFCREFQEVSFDEINDILPGNFLFWAVPMEIPHSSVFVTMVKALISKDDECF